MQIILMEKVVNLGGLGDVVKVKDGYARNFLIPQGKAKRATAVNLAEFEKRRAELESAQSAALASAQEKGAKLDGLMIQISSWAGVYVPLLTGPAYTAAKHGLVALSESINQAECVNGIRSCCINPGEVATPILNNRPVPVTDEDKAKMVQSEDMGETILFVARLPASVCVNEILISPTWNRGYVSALKG